MFAEQDIFRHPDYFDPQKEASEEDLRALERAVAATLKEALEPAGDRCIFTEYADCYLVKSRPAS